MSKTILISFIGMALILGLGWYFYASQDLTAIAQTTSTSSSTPSTTSTAYMIQLTSPTANSIVASPLAVSGKARGGWYFEGTFPVKLLNSSGTVLAQGNATAQGSWTTNDFVNFTANLSFTSPGSGTGTLVLEKSNPSGLSQNAAELRVPVRFGAGLPNTGGRLFWFHF